MREIKKILPALGIILIAVILRLLPHPANVAPITAMALFGGVYLNKKYALVVPILAMMISDIFLGFHNTILFVYLSFLLIGLIGIFIKKIKSAQTILISSFMSSILFFVITNFGVWLVGNLYPHTAEGLINAYILALPFFRNTIIGDLLYAGLFFGAYEVILHVFQRPIIAAK